MKALIGLIASLGTLLTALFTGRRAGRDSERVKQQERQIEQKDKANEIQKEQLKAGANGPRGSNDLDDRMRDRTF